MKSGTGIERAGVRGVTKILLLYRPTQIFTPPPLRRDLVCSRPGQTSQITAPYRPFAPGMQLGGAGANQSGIGPGQP